MTKLSGAALEANPKAYEFIVSAMGLQGWPAKYLLLVDVKLNTEMEKKSLEYFRVIVQPTMYNMHVISKFTSLNRCRPVLGNIHLAE